MASAEWVSSGYADRVEWKAGAPMEASRGDPSRRARRHQRSLGTDLGTISGDMDGLYARSCDAVARRSRRTSTSRATQACRLQYWRWLNVEDSQYDKATIGASSTDRVDEHWDERR